MCLDFLLEMGSDELRCRRANKSAACLSACLYGYLLTCTYSFTSLFSPQSPHVFNVSSERICF